MAEILERGKGAIRVAKSERRLNNLKTIKCNSCNSIVSYKPEDVFCHWEYDYIFCPKCGELILLDTEVSQADLIKKDG